MRLHRRRTGVVVLAALVAVLLPAGVLSAVVLNRPAPAVDRRVGVAEVARSAVVEEQTTTSTPPVTVAPKPVVTAPPTTTTKPPLPATTTTTRKPTTTTSTTVAPLSDPNWFAIPNVAPAGTWHTEANGVTARLRIDPATPVAGQPVRFFIDVASAGACCTVFLTFGDDSGEEFRVNTERLCSDPSPFSPGTHSSVTSHTYARPGAYKARLAVLSGDPCTTPGSPATDLHWMPWVSGNPINACVGVGPGPAADAGCPVNDQ